MLCAVVVVISIVSIVLIFVIYTNKRNQVRIFDSTEELTAFLRKKYTSEIKHNHPINGLVVNDASTANLTRFSYGEILDALLSTY